MKTEEIKNLMYEAEGLLELVSVRPEKMADIRPLIRRRIAEILAALDAPDENDVQAIDIPPLEEVVAEERVAEVFDTVVDTPEETFEKELEYETAMETYVAPKRDVPAFCLNDRFRFRRAIFGGNNDDFNAAMDHLATLDSFADAEEFFFGDLDLNPEDPDVVDFMAIIKKYFGE